MLHYKVDKTGKHDQLFVVGEYDIPDIFFKYLDWKCFDVKLQSLDCISLAVQVIPWLTLLLATKAPLASI